MAEKWFQSTINNHVTLKLNYGDVQLKPYGYIKGPEEELDSYSFLVESEGPDEDENRPQRPAQAPQGVKEPAPQDRRPRQQNRPPEESQLQGQNEKQSYAEYAKQRDQQQDLSEEQKEQIIEDAKQEEPSEDELPEEARSLKEKGVYDARIDAFDLDEINFRKTSKKELRFILDKFAYPYDEDDKYKDLIDYVRNIQEEEAESKSSTEGM